MGLLIKKVTPRLIYGLLRWGDHCARCPKCNWTGWDSESYKLIQTEYQKWLKLGYDESKGIKKESDK